MRSRKSFVTGKVFGMGSQLDRLVSIVAQLRGPKGCPWDKEQTHASLLSSLLDETYEFFEAVEEDDRAMMKEELGDILLQVVFHAQIAQEEKQFDLEEIAQEICEKLIRRHPHVFGDTTVGSSQEVLVNWEQIKRQEKGKEKRKYIVDGIAKNLPALFRAEKVQKRVSRVGFDWKDITPVLDKVIEEFDEFQHALQQGNTDHAAEEMGDILFALVNVARHSSICAEDALRYTITKFEKRFRFIEDQLRKQNKTAAESTLEELDALWEQSKRHIGHKNTND